MESFVTDKNVITCSPQLTVVSVFTELRLRNCVTIIDKEKLRGGSCRYKGKWARTTLLLLTLNRCGHLQLLQMQPWMKRKSFLPLLVHLSPSWERLSLWNHSWLTHVINKRLKAYTYRSSCSFFIIHSVCFSSLYWSFCFKPSKSPSGELMKFAFSHESSCSKGLLNNWICSVEWRSVSFHNLSCRSTSL